MKENCPEFAAIQRKQKIFQAFFKLMINIAKKVNKQVMLIDFFKLINS